MMSSLRLPVLPAALAVLLGVTLHFLTTVPIADYPARIGLSDLVVPFCLAGVVMCLARDGWHVSMSRWRSRWFIVFLALCTLWLAVSILTGRHETGHWISWALLQKGAGWILLMAYMAVGAWLAVLHPSLRSAVTRAFIIGGWITALISLGLMEAWIMDPQFTFQGQPYLRAQGFFDNPNAFGIAMVAVAGMQLVLMRQEALRPTLLAQLGLALVLVAIVLSRSRSAWIAVLPMLVAIQMLRGMHWRHLLVGVIGGAGILVGMYGLPHVLAELSGLISTATANGVGANSASGVATEMQILTGKFVDSGVTHRVLITEHALALWQQHPIVGAGIGSFQWHEMQGNEEQVATIHSSAIWVLTEMGLVGLGLFVAMFAVGTAALWRGGREGDYWALAGLAVAIALVTASIGTEVLYQRYLWLLIGLAMAKPSTSAISDESGDRCADSSAS